MSRATLNGDGRARRGRSWSRRQLPSRPRPGTASPEASVGPRRRESDPRRTDSGSTPQQKPAWPRPNERDAREAPLEGSLRQGIRTVKSRSSRRVRPDAGTAGNSAPPGFARSRRPTRLRLAVHAFPFGSPGPRAARRPASKLQVPPRATDRSRQTNEPKSSPTSSRRGIPKTNKPIPSPENTASRRADFPAVAHRPTPKARRTSRRNGGNP